MLQINNDSALSLLIFDVNPTCGCYKIVGYIHIHVPITFASNQYGDYVYFLDFNFYLKLSISTSFTTVNEVVNEESEYDPLTFNLPKRNLLLLYHLRKSFGKTLYTI